MNTSACSGTEMKTRDFFFDLPPELIAQYPSEQRGESRLMTVCRRSGAIGHKFVKDLPELLDPGTLMIFNDSKVRRARLLGKSQASGGALEFLLLKSLDDNRWRVLSNRSKRLRPGKVCLFPEGLKAVTEKPEEGEWIVRFSFPVTDEYLEKYGHIPLPPYIKREDRAGDADRYQTVYAAKLGSAAAPTAGLHFTADLLGKLDNRGIRKRFVTLHVGLGTFLPVRTENLEDHRMHKEEYEIPEGTRDGCSGGETGRPICSRRRHDEPTCLGISLGGGNATARAWIDEYFHLPRLPIPLCRPTLHEFSYARIDPAHAGLGLYRKGTAFSCLSGSYQRRLPLLFLRRCHVDLLKIKNERIIFQ